MNRKLILLLINFTSLFSSIVARETEAFFPLFAEGAAKHVTWPDSFEESIWWPWNEEEASVKEIEKPLNPFTPEKLIGLRKRLQDQIVGQDRAIDLTVSALERYAQGLNDPDAPIACLLYMGSTGVGKTQLVKELGRDLLGSEQKLIRLNMSEYADPNYAMRLLGSPPGYRDHHEGGQLTEALKKNPYAIVLLDEIEKAHPIVLKTFLQLLDEGFISDAKGTLIDCRNMLFILTSNLEGQRILTQHDLGYNDQAILSEIRGTYMKRLTPEFFNRLEPVIFRGFKQNIIDELIQKLLLQATEELMGKKKISVEFDSSVVHFLKTNSHDYLLGARPIKRFIKQTIIAGITEAMMQNYLQMEDKAFLTCQDNDLIIQNLNQEAPFIWHWNVEQAHYDPPFKFENLLNLENKLKLKVLGQPNPIEMTVEALIRYAAGLTRKNSPIATFLYVGPTGVGKTQLAKELAIELMGGEEHLIRFDMSEYSEEHSPSRLLGAPFGYIDHEKGGLLTEALKQHPYSIVLLDEIEKAHPKVLKMFLQIFDDGRVTDSEGGLVDCSNVIFIATTNLASAKILSMQKEGFSEDAILDAIRPALAKAISPELCNRVEAAVFKGLTPDLLDQLIRKQLKEVEKEVLAKKKVQVLYDTSLIEYMKLHGYDYEYGARPLRRLIERTVVTSIAKALIVGTITSGDIIKLSYDLNNVVIEKVP